MTLNAVRGLSESSRLIRTPYRLSLFGGGTDYPHWFRRHGGAVIGASLARYSYVWLLANGDSQTPDLPPHEQRKLEAVLTACGWRERSPALQRRHGLPPRSGLGGSSALTVGLLHASRAAKEEPVTRARLASEAIDVEQRLLREEVGYQDPILVAMGGIRRIDFETDGSYRCSALSLSEARLRYLEDRLLLVDVGGPRQRSMAAETATVAATGTDVLHEIRALVDECHRLLVDASSDLGLLGPLLDRTWALKRRLTRGITNDSIDSFYREAIRAGATGGKLLGAGGGGFFLLFVPQRHRSEFLRTLAGSLWLPVRFDFSGSLAATPLVGRDHATGSLLATSWAKAEA